MNHDDNIKNEEEFPDIRNNNQSEYHPTPRIMIPFFQFPFTSEFYYPCRNYYIDPGLPHFTFSHLISTIYNERDPFNFLLSQVVPTNLNVPLSNYAKESNMPLMENRFPTIIDYSKIK